MWLVECATPSPLLIERRTLNGGCCTTMQPDGVEWLSDPHFFLTLYPLLNIHTTILLGLNTYLPTTNYFPGSSTHEPQTHLGSSAFAYNGERFEFGCRHEAAPHGEIHPCGCERSESLDRGYAWRTSTSR
jgi:hypothetical protein